MMYIKQLLDAQPTCKLREDYKGRGKGENAAHRPSPTGYEVEFIKAPFFGGKTVIQVTAVEFNQYFVILPAPR